MWTKGFPFANNLYQYSDFIRAVAKYPMFCNEVPSSSASTLEDICKQELAALMAHISYESGDLQAVA